MEFSSSPLRSMFPATIPRGYHFHPTDEQLISYYLKLKVECIAIPAIPDIAMEDVELYGPSQSKELWELFRDLSTPNVSFYVFSKLETTSPSAKKIKKVAGRGTWDLQHSTNVFQSDDPNKTVLGLKRMFRFEMKRGKENEVVPRWIMHEYTLSGVPHYALCEIKHIVSEKEIMANHQDRGSDHDLEYLGVCLERNKRSGLVCVNGDGRGKRVRLDHTPISTDSFGADNIENNQVSDFFEAQLQIPIPIPSPRDRDLFDDGYMKGDGVLDVPQNPLPSLGLIWEDMIATGALSSSDINNIGKDPTLFMFDPLFRCYPSLAIPQDLLQQQRQGQH